MMLLVDAFNVIYKFPVLEEHMAQGRLAEARRGLLEIVYDFAKKWKKPLDIHLVFDGKKNKGDATESEIVSGIKVIYSHDLSADHIIKQFIKHNARPADIRVVTSDKDILGHAKKWHCDRMTSEDFHKWVVSTLEDKPLPEEKPQTEDVDVGYWMSMFKNRRPGK
ncbi:MAG TPA: NYN domain-containing protein [Leptospiraceae bacterium]|jgi:predicted RNA-binding protein with PIN domain|nr:NYN domain-containing protein [Leptospirales bacterium]HMU82851.1 NYN domain-containing protein [Leptospiraceae bacterium]HMW62046.1 NYN domain-containing protein [Leptospiraceae bacterium]HMX56352.1 NYN domain-containing protein [Leptospiraceae bacterium]HMY47603.1 NYN domain-containing protein [Leptospiraceae bacterium]